MICIFRLRNRCSSVRIQSGRSVRRFAVTPAWRCSVPMKQQEFAKAVEEIVQADPRFSPEAYEFISDAVAADFDTLAGFDIYMAGPPPMVAATLPALLHHGAESDHIFSDAWPTAEKGAK